MPLGTGNIIQTAKGSLAVSDPTLPAPTAAGSTVLILMLAETLMTGPTGLGFAYDAQLNFTDGPGTDGARLGVFRKPDDPGGVTTWAVPEAVGAWIVYEVSDLYPAVDAEVEITDALVVTGETLWTSVPGYTDTDIFCLTVWGGEDPSGTTGPTWGSYTNSYTESQEQSVVGVSGTNGLTLAAAHRFPGALNADCTATLTVSGGHTATAGVIHLAYRSTVDPLIFLTGFGPGTLAGANVGTAKYIPLVTGTPAIVADATTASGFAAELSGTAAVEGLGLDSSIRVAGSDIDVGMVRVKFPGSLPAGDLDLVTWDSAGAVSNAVRFRVSDSKLIVGIAGGGGTPAAGPVVVPDVWYRLDWRLTFSAFTVEWQVDGVVQPTYGIAAGDSLVAVYLGWAQQAATATVRYADWCDSVTPADYPIAETKVVSFLVDPAGTVTVNTAASFSTFTANGTINATFNVTTARDAVKDIPPVIGASAAGFVQDAVDTAGHVDIPMTSYTLLPGEVVMGVRMVVCGWAVSATAATLGFRIFNGTTEELLQAGTVNPLFDNSTTAPGWFAKMATLANFNTQAKLDGMQNRVGWASDATPDIGINATLTEVGIRAAAAGPPQQPTVHMRGPRPAESAQVAGPYAMPAMSSQIFQGG